MRLEVVNKNSVVAKSDETICIKLIEKCVRETAVLDIDDFVE